MQDFIIVGILVIVVGIGITYTIRNFKNKKSCCGSSGTYIKKKKLKKVIEQRPSS